MLHNIQEVTQQERRTKQAPIPLPGVERRKAQVPLSQSVKITASWFVSRALAIGAPVFKMTPVPGGANPGSEQEFLLELMIPAKVVVQAAPTQPPKAAPVPPAPAKPVVPAVRPATTPVVAPAAKPAVLPPAQHPLAK
jgi:hypothetical protein